jgi:hypothetical protein
MRARGLSIILALLGGLLLAVGFLTGAPKFGTPQAAAAVPQDPLEIFTFQGKVFQGEIGDESSPIPNAIIELWGANNPYPDPGSFIISTTTDPNGWYGLSVDDSLAMEYFHILENNPSGYISNGATTLSGTVQTSDWIEFAAPLTEQELSGNKFWDQESATSLGPDLQIVAAWSEGNAICYQGWNAGDEDVPEGHSSALYIDDSFAASHLVEFLVPVGETWSGCFVDVSWSCSGAVDNIAVIADHPDEVVESNETNNTWDDVWICDSTPPLFISGPQVMDTGLDYAVIGWETDEPSDSWVRYGDIAGDYHNEVGEASPTSMHEILLDGLSPSTTYHFVARSSDPSGNTATSKDLVFQTLPAPDGINPEVSLLDPGAITTTVTVTATASDNTGISKVIFLVDGEPIFTDYSWPYAFPFDPGPYLNGGYNLSAQAFDLSGQQSSDSVPVNIAKFVDAAAPTVDIIAPLNNATVSGKVDVTADLSDDTGIISARFYVDGDYRQFKPYNVSNPPTSDSVTFTWDTRGEVDDSYRLGIEVFDKDGKASVDTVDVTVLNVTPPPPPSPPWLEVVGHSVVRNGNVFVVLLSVKNTGDATARNVKILDGLHGFQPIEHKTASVDYLTEYNPAGGFAYADIRPKSDIVSGETRLFIFNAVPFLLAPNPSTPSVGYFVDLYWDSATQSGYHDYVQMPVAKTVGGDTIPQAHTKATQAADYLIVTNPYRLFAIYNPSYYQGPSVLRTQTNELLSSMAKLAFYKDGVLGYNTTNNSESLRDLVKVGGKWSSVLAPGWTSNGYLLIVGEVEIVSAWWRFFGTQYTTKGDIPFITSYTDYPYASTYGDEIRPELKIARIIGNNAYYLRRPIETAINLYEGQSGYDYNGLMKFAVSGFDKCMSGGCDKIYYKSEVNNVVKVLPGPIIGLHTPDLAVYKQGTLHITDTKSAILNTFFTNTPDQDIIFLAGHGNGGKWDAINVGDVHNQAKPFGNTNPFVFASSCDTAHYPTGISLAEAFLNRYAAAYLGAINKGACFTNHMCPHADTFFSKWNQNTAFSQALRDTKNAIGSSFFDRYWAGIYNLFGDAKFGGAGTVPSAANLFPPSSSNMPLTASGIVDIAVPNYEITRENGEDVVQIPGGQLPMLPGVPAVPSYVVIYQYQAGTHVQDVALTHRADPEIIPGLEIFTTTLALAGDVRIQPRLPLEQSEWWPEEDYEWQVFESPETTTLMLTLYPFVYDAETGVGMFYNYYEFDIQTTDSTVEITTLETDRHMYLQGETVAVNAKLRNTAPEPLDVVVRASIQQAASGESTTGLMLQTLDALEGQASFTTWWDTGVYPPGDYSVLVELLDMQGNLLDRGMESFQLGERSAEVFNLSAEPGAVDPGESVALVMDFENAGTVPLTATLVLEVQSDNSGTVEIFTMDTPELVPAESSQITRLWDTYDLPPGRYQVIGYAKYFGMATNVLDVNVTINNKIYLPVVRR